MQPPDILGLRTASDAQPSPDGQYIAYVVSELDRDADQARSSVWLVPSRGGTPQRLTDGAQSCSMPRWAPDGRWLAFIAAKEAGPQIWVVAIDTNDSSSSAGILALDTSGAKTSAPGNDVQSGADSRPLTDVPGGVTGPPVWSPDGRRIAFTARVSDAPPRQGAPRVIKKLRYLLNGAGYIGDGFWHVFTVEPAETTVVQVTRGDWHHFAPAWSPDSTHITCITSRREDWDTEWVWDVYVLDAKDCRVAPRRLTESQGTCAAPAWSPDGRWIAYFDNQCPGTAYTQDYHLCLVPADGGTTQTVSRVLDRGCQLSQPPATNEPPRWSAHSTTVFFHVREGGFYHYYAYDLSDETLRPVRAPHDVLEPIDGLVRQSADGGRLAFTAATAVRPAELFSAAPGGTNCRQLTDLNGAALALFDVRAPQRLSHTSPEGWQIESWLWLPPAYRSGDAPLPTVLYYHGGPHNTVALGFNDLLHLLAAAGFAVVAVNFRGSTGFGAAFADCILGDWGSRELVDGLAIVDALVEQGVVDPNRLGVFGGSYGGFMTNLALARTERFVAGVSYATISGLDTWTNQTDHWESVDWDSGGPTWQIPGYYRSHSPLTDVAHIRAPLLILHGEEDYRCAVGEADQLFGALRKLKRTVELVRYPNGPHAFAHVGPPSHRLDFVQRVTDWFQRYVSHGGTHPGRDPSGADSVSDSNAHPGGDPSGGDTVSQEEP
jgi:dipeptidyl aminopeptidase/acylaminoacyl peptidase